MFEKFGEFDSYEEINRAAAAQKAEGDEEALTALAEENGIDREGAEDYMDGCIEELTTAAEAAIGKLEVEKKELELEGVLLEWAEELEMMCLGSRQLAIAVRKKGKELAGYLGLVTEEGWRKKTKVTKKIVEKTVQVKKAAGGHDLYIGIPDKKTRKDLAMRYYVGIGVRK